MLSDALLLDEYRDTLDIWIAARSDGAKGSGTQSDPFNGSSAAYPAIPITLLSKSGSLATVTTNGNHNFLPGDLVTVSGVKRTKPPTVFDPDIFYIGTFPVTPTDATHFTYTMIGEPASTQAVADSGGINCWRERERFDQIMRALPSNCRIHIGPGIFDTKGYGSNIAGMHLVKTGYTGSWQPQAGQKFLGAGIGLTALKLVNASSAELQYSVIGTDYFVYSDAVEIRNLTIDCNIAGQPNQSVACAAIAVTGRHIRIRRVRVINFASQTSPGNYVENFVIYSPAPHPNQAEAGQEGVDTIIEDCIVEWPSHNNVHNSSIILIGGGAERPDDGVLAFQRGSAIRNCYINGERNLGRIVAIQSISYNPTTGEVTLTAKAAHGRTYPGNVRVRAVQGMSLSGQPSDLLNGVFAVEVAGLTATTLSYKTAIGLAGTPSGGFVGGGVTSNAIFD